MVVDFVRCCDRQHHEYFGSRIRGDPATPFPWFNWNNRPFVSAKELMLVPTTAPSSLFNLGELGGTLPVTGTWSGTTATPYEPSAAPQPPAGMGEYGNLANFFHSPQYQARFASNDIPRQQMSPNFYRLLEYVHVPSRFTGTETWLPPAKMQGFYTDPAAGTNNPNILPNHQLHPPFNRVSQFRDPGRVNINTVFDPYIWQGVIDDYKTIGQGTPPWRNLWNAVCQSRIGANLAGGADRRSERKLVFPTESRLSNVRRFADSIAFHLRRPSAPMAAIR